MGIAHFALGLSCAAARRCVVGRWRSAEPWVILCLAGLFGSRARGLAGLRGCCLAKTVLWLSGVLAAHKKTRTLRREFNLLITGGGQLRPELDQSPT